MNPKCARCRKAFSPDRGGRKCCAKCREQARLSARRLHADRRALGICTRCTAPLTEERKAIAAECSDCVKANDTAYFEQRRQYQRRRAKAKRAA